MPTDRHHRSSRSSRSRSSRSRDVAAVAAEHGGPPTEGEADEVPASARRADARRTDPPASRDERKLRTRRKLLDAALARVSRDQGFSDLSLREVTRDAGVTPAAFYRHFPDMEALGLALVEESFATLRDLMREARAEPLPTTHLVKRSVETFLDYVDAHPRHFRFIAKERYGGSTTLRFAIRAEIRQWTSELATDLARFPALAAVSTPDLAMVARLVVQGVINATELTLDLPPDDAEGRAAIRVQAERELRLVLVGAAAWRS